MLHSPGFVFFSQVRSDLIKPNEFLPYDPTQEPIFPPELMVGHVISTSFLAQIFSLFLFSLPVEPAEPLLQQHSLHMGDLHLFQ